MKLIRYCIIAVLVSSSLCHGFIPSTVKHGGAGIGKLGVASFCMFTVISSVLKKASWSELKEGADPDLDDSYDYFEENWLKCSVLDTYYRFKHCGLKGMRTSSTTPLMHFALNDTINLVVPICFLTYGAYRCTSSAGKSFKEAWNSLKKTPDRVNAESSKKALPVRKDNGTSEVTQGGASDTKEVALPGSGSENKDSEDGEQREDVILM